MTEQLTLLLTQLPSMRNLSKPSCLPQLTNLFLHWLPILPAPQALRLLPVFAPPAMNPSSPWQTLSWTVIVALIQEVPSSAAEAESKWKLSEEAAAILLCRHERLPLRRLAATYLLRTAELQLFPRPSTPVLPLIAAMTVVPPELAVLTAPLLMVLTAAADFAPAS